SEADELVIEQLDAFVRVRGLATCQELLCGASADPEGFVVARASCVDEDERLVLRSGLLPGFDHVGQPMDPEMAPLVLLRPDERVELQKALRCQIEPGCAGSLV